MMPNVLPVTSQKVCSGIEGFDRLLFGGFPPGRSYLISGEPGAGKTIFTLQFLLQGISQGESGIYISIDEKPEHVIADALELGWDLRPHLASGALQILDVSSYFSSCYDQGGSHIDVDRIILDILGYVKKTNVQRLVIDPIAPLILNDRSFENLVEYIRKLIFAIEDDIGCTTLLTSYVPVGSTQVSHHGIEEFASSGIVVLKLSKKDGKWIRTINVRKMRGTRIDLTEYSYEILPKRGIVLRQPV